MKPFAVRAVLPCLGDEPKKFRPGFRPHLLQERHGISKRDAVLLSLGANNWLDIVEETVLPENVGRRYTMCINGLGARAHATPWRCGYHSCPRCNLLKQIELRRILKKHSVIKKINGIIRRDEPFEKHKKAFRKPSNKRNVVALRQIRNRGVSATWRAEAFYLINEETEGFNLKSVTEECVELISFDFVAIKTHGLLEYYSVLQGLHVITMHKRHLSDETVENIRWKINT